MAEAAVRDMNLRADRFAEPLEAVAPVAFNGFANELAFRLAETAHRAGMGAVNAELLDRVYPSTEAYIQRLPRAMIPTNGSEREKVAKDAIAIAGRLLDVVGVASRDQPVCFRPPFLGSGVLDACEGDILIGKDLWEIKSGDRHFRQTDVRQVLIYCALNHASRTHVIERYCLANPRAGVVASGTLTDLASAVAGCDPKSLFEDIVGFLSFQDIST